MSCMAFRIGLEKQNRADVMRHQARMTEGPLTKNCIVRIIDCILIELNPRLTKVFFVTRLTKGGLLQPPLNFPNPTPYELGFGINGLVLISSNHTYLND